MDKETQAKLIDLLNNSPDELPDSDLADLQKSKHSSIKDNLHVASAAGQFTNPVLDDEESKAASPEAAGKAQESLFDRWITKPLDKILTAVQQLVGMGKSQEHEAKQIKTEAAQKQPTKPSVAPIASKDTIPGVAKESLQSIKETLSEVASVSSKQVTEKEKEKQPIIIDESFFKKKEFQTDNGKQLDLTKATKAVDELVQQTVKLGGTVNYVTEKSGVDEKVKLDAERKDEKGNKYGVGALAFGGPDNPRLELTQGDKIVEKEAKEKVPGFMSKILAAIYSSIKGVIPGLDKSSIAGPSTSEAKDNKDKPQKVEVVNQKTDTHTDKTAIETKVSNTLKSIADKHKETQSKTATFTNNKESEASKETKEIHKMSKRELAKHIHERAAETAKTVSGKTGDQESTLYGMFLRKYKNIAAKGGDMSKTPKFTLDEAMRLEGEKRERKGDTTKSHLGEAGSHLKSAFTPHGVGGDRPEHNLTAFSKGLSSLGKALGPGGKTLAAVGGFAAGLVGSFAAIREWGDHLHQSNMQFAEFSGAMAAVQQEQRARDIQLSYQRGNRRADAARDLAESRHELNRHVAAVVDPVMNVWDRYWSRWSEGMTTILRTLGVRPEEAGDAPLSLQDELLYGSDFALRWWQSYGRPDNSTNPFI